MATGTLGSSTILPGWAGHPRRRRGAAPARPPVHVDNDANLGALAELTWARRAASRRGVHQDQLRFGAGSARRPGLPRAGGTAGEIGHLDAERERPDVPVRQPRLPGDVRRRALCLLRPAHGDGLTIGARRAGPAGDALPRARINDAGRESAPALGDLCNCSTRRGRGRGDLGRRRRAAARRHPRGGRPSRAARARPKAVTQSCRRACWASAPRCSAHSTLVINDTDRLRSVGTGCRLLANSSHELAVNYEWDCLAKRR